MLKYSQKKINVSELKNLQSKRVFLRADFNVPFNKQDNMVISDDTRIRGALPTIKHLIDGGIIPSHFDHS